MGPGKGGWRWEEGFDGTGGRLAAFKETAWCRYVPGWLETPQIGSCFSAQ